MAGEYGEIKSRADYLRILFDSKRIVERIVSRSPANPVMQNIRKQLDAMTRWTDNGRQPTETERRNIDVGLIAVRELDGATDEIGELADHLCALNNYFEDWPTDEEAANAGDDEEDGD
jgi:hypothetical protein